jgi:hypothetical protein
MTMAIELQIESLEGLDESVQPLYIPVDPEDTAKGYRLDVAGLPDVNGLKTALDKERKIVKEQKSALSGFSGVDVEKYQDLIAREATLSDHDPEKIKEMIDSRVRQNDDAWKNKERSWAEKHEASERKLSKLTIRDELQRIGVELGVIEGEPMEDFVYRGERVFKLVEGDVKPLDTKNEILYGESGVETLTMREFGKKLSTTATHLFKSSAGGGASNTGSGSAGSGAVRYKSDLRTPSDKAKFIGKHGREVFLKLPDRKEVI